MQNTAYHPAQGRRAVCFVTAARAGRSVVIPAQRAELLIEETDDMLFMLTNRTRAGLGAAQFEQLAALAKAFYASIPPDVQIRGEWAAADQSHNYTLLEAPDVETVRRIQAPFEPFTETQIVPVTGIAGWTAS